MRGIHGGFLSRYQAARGWLAVIAACLPATGCCGSAGHFLPEDQFGRTYYIDGAGNWGFGRHSVSRGLRDAGYRGRIIHYGWSLTLNPALDQAFGRFTARSQAKLLAREIEEYLRHYPDNRVNIVALSAGTGLAVWACESLSPPAKVFNLVLLSSSLSSHYDMSRALAHVEGKVYVYWSPIDGMLSGPVRLLGTIDGRLASTPAGLVGLQFPSPKICNIRWSHRYEAAGWTGSHVSTVREPFVRQVLARHVMPEPVEQTAATGSDASARLVAR